MKKITLVLVFILLAFYTSGQTVTIEGDPYGGNPYGTIAAAISASSNGDVINITGTHTENLSWTNKNITIKGDDATTAIIDGGATAPVITIFGGTAPTITFENLTITNGAASARGGGIYYDVGSTGTAGHITLNNVIVESNTATTEGGGIAMLGGNITINNSIIKSNTSTLDGGGLLFTTKGTAMEMNIKNSLIQANRGRNGGGIYVNGNANNVAIDVNLENVTITGNTTTSGTAGAGGGAFWSKAFNNASNVTVKLVHVTTYDNSHAAAAKNGFVFTGGSAAFTNISVYNSILVNTDVIAQKSMDWTRTNVVDIVNSIIGGSDDAANTTYGNSANTFLDDGTKNNQKGRTATEAGLTGTLTDKGGFSNVIPITEGSPADDRCSVATGITIPTTDQRGYTRSGNNDAGAYEYYDNTWTGSSSSDWATAGNWTDGLPGNDDILIPDVTNAPVIGSSTNVSVNDIVISESDGLTINSGGTLIVNGTSSGNVTYKRTLGTTNWYLMSSPVAGVTFNDAFVTANNIASGTTDANNRGVATYDTTNDSWTYLQSGGSISSTAGVGYSVKQATAGDVTFTGTINTSDVSVSVVTGGTGGFNLLGVPFTSDLNSASFLSDNTGNLVSETLWVWNQGTGNYETKVTGDSFVLAAGQGFFVRANSATNLTIAESYQTTGGTFQRSADTEVKLLLTDGSSDRFAKIKYVDNATTGFDNGWDGETFGGITNPFDIFTNLVTGNQGKKYQVQSLPKSDMESTIVPIGITADTGEEITFTAEAMNLPAGLKVFLEDRQTNTFTRLDEANTEYTITLDKALNDIGRFYLHTSASALSTTEVHLEHISVYTTNSNNLRIVGIAQGNASVKLYNIVGKEVLSHNFTSNGVSDIALPKVTRGIYIVQVITEEGKLNKKIVLE